MTVGIPLLKLMGKENTSEKYVVVEGISPETTK